MAKTTKRQEQDVMRVALWTWNESECALHPAGFAEGGSDTPLVFFDLVTYTASAVVPADWTREQVDALLRTQCVEYKVVMEGCDEAEDDE